VLLEVAVTPGSPRRVILSSDRLLPGHSTVRWPATDVTLTADRESGRVLGGSIVGEDRAAIRIDRTTSSGRTGTSLQ